LDLELRTKSPAGFTAVLALLECFFSNVSMLSRGMILNGASLLFGASAAARRYAVRLGLLSKAGFVLLFLALFAGSMLTVNYFRSYLFSTTSAPSSQALQDITPVHSFVCRWVGLEGIMSISSCEAKGWPLLKEALREKYASTGTSFYDRKIVKGSTYVREGVEKKHFIPLPGLMGFLYYPGKPVFLFAALFLLGLLAAAVEYGVYGLSGGNLILCAIIGQVIAARYAHFGYAPARSYLLAGGIVVVAAAVYLFNRCAAAASQRAEGRR